MVEIYEYISIIKKYQSILTAISNICKKSNEIIEGNLITQQGDVDLLQLESIPKQTNLFILGKYSKNILEIGFNAGHSALILLISNPTSQITFFDICEHKYTLKCFQYLDKLFPNRMKLVSGDSTKTLPEFYSANKNKEFDLIHIDGGHTSTIANLDFYNSYKMCNGIMVFDDYWMPNLQELINYYQELDLVSTVNLHPTKLYTHIILKKKNQEKLEQILEAKRFITNWVDIDGRGNNVEIPKIIHQIWIGNKPIPFGLIKTWKDKHPDWKYILWDNEKVKNEEFINRDKIEICNNILGKSDLIRYEILYKYGGIYIDIDVICNKKLDNLITNKSLFAVYYNNKKELISNNVIGCTRYNPSLLKVIEYFKDIYDFDDPVGKNIVDITLLPFSNIMFNELKKSSDIVILDHYYFNPYDFRFNNLNQNDNVNLENSYGIHLWGSTLNNMTYGDIDIYQEEIMKLNICNKVFFICLHKENELLSNSIRKYKIWEPNITDIWINILKDSNKDELVVDVGANIGYYSLLSAAFGFNCYSFEPEKENLKRFKSSIMLNLFYNKIKIFENIVYKESNIKLDLKRVPGKNKNNGCLSISNVFNKINNIVDTGNNLSIKLDDVISNDKKICILKIDVEGAELDVIHGCMNILKNKQVKYFIIEISPKFLEIKYCKELATEICNYGYELFDIEQKKFISLDFFYNDINNIRQKDYIFKRIDILKPYCINLVNHQNRKNHILNIFGSNNVQFIDAINGNQFKKMTKKELLNNFPLTEKGINTLFDTNKEHGHDMTYGGLGLILTCQKFWKTIKEPTLIIEDDIDIDENFNKKLKNTLKYLPDNWDILYLGYYHDPRIKQITNNLENNIWTANRVYGLYGYIIHPRYCSKLLKNIFPCDYQIDTMINKENKFSNTYIVYPPIIHHPNMFKTSIQIYDQTNSKKIENSLNNINKINNTTYQFKN